ncbi:hypothetical protein GQ600_16638 [Phytophthora cactorum]|nr:hypothetical protein GQ600_16638 [Phytophthora cactorum]
MDLQSIVQAGLAVLNPAVRQYIQVQFDEEEKDMIRKATGPNGFIINVREQLNWSNCSSSWLQVPVKPMLRKIYTTFSINFNPTHWPQCQEQSTPPHGIDGRRGARRADIIDGYLQTAAATRTSSLSLLPTIGAPQQAQEGAHWRSKPCCPRIVTSLGIICATSDTRLGSMMGISWPCAGCSGCLHLHDKKNPSPLQCYEDSENYILSQRVAQNLYSRYWERTDGKGYIKKKGTPQVIRMSPWIAPDIQNPSEQKNLRVRALNAELAS